MKARVQAEESLAHITQAESEALKEFDAATGQIEEFARKAGGTAGGQGHRARSRPVVLKKKRVVQPASFVQTKYLETKADVDGFLDKLRMELEQAIANEERVEIR